MSVYDFCVYPYDLLSFILYFSFILSLFSAFHLVLFTVVTL